LVSSGTQGNITALLTHSPRGSEVIVGANTHIYNYEAGGISALGGMVPRVLPDPDGYPLAADIEHAIRPENVHYAPASLVCVEDTHNRAGGAPIPLDQLEAISNVAHAHGLPVHMDGARVFNAAIAQGVDVKEITRHVDTLTFCLTKGLSCPVGSLLCGSADFIHRARLTRKMLGSGMRQAGWIASAGIVALESLVSRLAEDHANARVLAERLAQIEGVAIDPDKVQTNLVFFDLTPAAGCTAQELIARLAPAGVRCNAPASHRIRMVTRRGITRDDVEYAAEATARALRGELTSSTPVAAGAY
jgi:threonine aldolase